VRAPIRRPLPQSAYPQASDSFPPTVAASPRPTLHPKDTDCVGARLHTGAASRTPVPRSYQTSSALDLCTTSLPACPHARRCRSTQASKPKKRLKQFLPGPLNMFLQRLERQSTGGQTEDSTELIHKLCAHESPHVLSFFCSVLCGLSFLLTYYFHYRRTSTEVQSSSI